MVDGLVVLLQLERMGRLPARWRLQTAPMGSTNSGDCMADCAVRMAELGQIVFPEFGPKEARQRLDRLGAKQVEMLAFFPCTRE